MELLPNELREEILRHLQVQDIKSIRLASTSWAALAQQYLINPTFLSLPHRDDFSRLLSLSRQPAFGRNIERLELDMGELNEYHARHNTFFIQYMRDPEDRDHESHSAWTEYAELKRQKESLASRYCDRDLLDEAFRNLPNLRAVDVDLTSCPFKHPLLQQIWQIPTTRLLSRVSTTQRFSNILFAARHLNLKSLTHDCMPFEVWNQRSILETVPAAFSALCILKVCLDYSVFPNALPASNGFYGLGQALRCAANLETLHIGFANSIRPHLCFTECIGDHTWRSLQTLGLEGMNLSEDDIAALVLRHAATLKRLQLGIYKASGYTQRVANMQNLIQFRQGTLKGLLTRVREGVRLKKLNMKGDVMEETNALTTYRYGSGLYDDKWLRVSGSGHTAAAALAAERFVLGEAEWAHAEFRFSIVPVALTQSEMVDI